MFSLGLLLVIVAGAELFTGNSLLAMAWAEGKIKSGEVLKNWVVICAANFAGAAGLAVVVVLSGHTEMNGGAVREAYVQIGAHKAGLLPVRASSAVCCAMSWYAWRSGCPSRAAASVPVVTRAGLLVGIVTLDDLLRIVVAQLDDLVGAISGELVAEARERP